MQKESFGIMDQGYFVSRGQILDWINNLLQLNVTKIQQLGAGSIYCQIFDVVHPGKLSVSKINWKAKNDYQFIANLKLLQSGFEKAGIKRYVQVQKLAKAKYQDNLQFIQWLKRYYDINCGDRGNNYNAIQKRLNAKIDFSFADKNVVPKQFNGSGQVYGPKYDLNDNKKSYAPSGINKSKEKQNSKSIPKVSHGGNVKKINISNNGTKNWQLMYQNERIKIQNLQNHLTTILNITEGQKDSADKKIYMIRELLNQVFNGSNHNNLQNNMNQSNVMEVEH